MMKKTTILLIILSASLTFNSCNGDDDPQATSQDFNALIVGTWKTNAQILNGKNLDFSDECQVKETTEFKNDSTFKAIELDPIDGNCVESTPSLGNWNIKNSNLTMNYSQIGDLTENEKYEFEIIELTTSSLKIKINTTDIDEDGQNDQYELQYVK